MTDILTASSPLNTAVLFIVFNRPDNTARVFEAIRKAKPPRLYVASDGPRDGHQEDAEKVAKVRDIVSLVDWPCEVKTLFHKKNVGCQFGPKSGIDWLFQHEEQGIVLEDDCLPSQSFFRFCEDILDRYKNNENIMAVTGINITRDLVFDGDYFFSRYPLMWGWASWRRAWMKYDSTLSGWETLKKENWLLHMDIGGFPFQQTWSRSFDLTRQLGDKATWWDYQWIYTCWVNNGMTIAPSKNLICNIGIGEDVDATHTTNYQPMLVNLTLHELKWPLTHPVEFQPNLEVDAFISKHWFYADWITYFKSLIKAVPGVDFLNSCRIKIKKKRSQE